MKWKTLALAFVLCTCTLFAKTQYDIGDGRTLVLNDDGTYEILESQFDTSVLVGKQYRLDMDAIIDEAIDYAIAQDPSIAIFGKEILVSLIENTGLLDQLVEEIPDISFIVISSDTMLATMSGEEPMQCEYTVTGGGKITIKAEGGDVGGTVEKDGSKIVLDADGLNVTLVPVE